MKRTVTQNDIDALLAGAEIKVETVMEKCTVAVVKLENGFILTASSACVCPENYDEALGTELCRKKIEDRLWELEGYALQKELHAAGEV